MDQTTVTLPARDTMLAGLNHFAGKSHSLQQFYPTLLEHAGEQGTIEWVVSMLIFAIEGHTLDMPAINANLLYMEAPRFIDALLHENWGLANQAKAILAERLLH
jgi:hypothetical protein